MTEGSTLEKILAWPFYVIKASTQFNPKNSWKINTPTIIAAGLPIAGAILVGKLISPPLLGAYLGGGLANIMVLPLTRELLKYELTGKLAKRAEITHRDVSGPTSGTPLAPIIGFNPNPQPPRYPFGTGHMYTLHEGLNRGSTWEQARRLAVGDF